MPGPQEPRGHGDSEAHLWFGAEGGWPQPVAHPHGSLEGGTHRSRVSVPRNPSLVCSAHVCSCCGAGWWWGRHCPRGLPKGELGAAPAEGAPRLKTDLAGARRQQKLCLCWPRDRERDKLRLVLKRKTGLMLHQFCTRMMPCKNCMAASKGDRQYESLESTHSYCNTEKKEKKRPKPGL